jgi:hypothetical protein
VLSDVKDPTFLDNRLTDGSEVTSLKRRPRFTTRKTFRYSFLLEAESPQGHSTAGLGKLNKVRFGVSV